MRFDEFYLVNVPVNANYYADFESFMGTCNYHRWMGESRQLEFYWNRQSSAIIIWDLVPNEPNRNAQPENRHCSTDESVVCDNDNLKQLAGMCGIKKQTIAPEIFHKTHSNTPKKVKIHPRRMFIVSKNRLKYESLAFLLAD